MKMRFRYILSVSIIISLIIGLMYLLLYPPSVKESPLGRIIKNANIFVPSLAALLAAVIALSAADPKKNKVKIEIEEPYIADKEKEVYEEGELDNNVKACYEKFPVTSYRVHFRMKNTSGFDLKNPVFTFNKLPIEKQRPYSETGNKPYSTRHFTFSIVRTDKRSHSLEVDKKLLISLDGPPYWNRDSKIDFWIRMVLDSGGLGEFDVDISVNCENADGVTEPVKINPKELLKIE
jgi:hypothetical protein